jgi:cobalamin biosynthesis protein CbiG
MQDVLTHTHTQVEEDTGWPGVDEPLDLKLCDKKAVTSAYVSIRQHTSAYVSILTGWPGVDEPLDLKLCDKKAVTYADAC